MNSKIRTVLALSVTAASLLAAVSGCSQGDNPTPVQAAPPPPPKPEELKVPKKDASGQQYGANPKYKEAMDRAAKRGGGASPLIVSSGCYHRPRNLRSRC